MALDDPLLNCATAVCCPPEAQILALTDEVVKQGVCQERAEAEPIIRWVVKHFDLAEKGALRPLVESIIRLHKAKA